MTSSGHKMRSCYAPDRRKVLEEAFRVLRPGGELIFTDPMQADDVPDGVLQPVYDRLNLRDLGSMRFYREAVQALGFEVLDQRDLVRNLRTQLQPSARGTRSPASRTRGEVLPGVPRQDAGRPDELGGGRRQRSLSRGASNISENPPDSDMPAAHGRDRLDGWSSPVSLTPRTA